MYGLKFDPKYEKENMLLEIAVGLLCLDMQQNFDNHRSVGNFDKSLLSWIEVSVEKQLTVVLKEVCVVRKSICVQFNDSLQLHDNEAYSIQSMVYQLYQSGHQVLALAFLSTAYFIWH